jgi:hypothetical protein
MYQIELLGAAQAGNHLDEFTDLLRDAAESGASIGFLAPLDDTAIFYREIHL